MRIVFCIVIFALCACSCTTTHPVQGAAESWPALVRQQTASQIDQEFIAQLTGSNESPAAVWIDVLDVNGDAREDAIVTVERDETAGARGRVASNTTYVLLGTQEPHHAQDLRSDKPWLSIQTLWYMTHARFPDILIRRQFCIFRRHSSWYIQITEREYTNQAGEISTRGLYLARSAESLVLLDELPLWRPKLSLE